MDKGKPASNGFRPRTWSDLIAIATIITLFVSVVAWGLKLEGELNQVRNELSDVKRQVGNGILPRAEERIRNLEREIERMRENP